MKYIVYGTPSCSFCNKAKTLLEIHKQNYAYKEVGTELTKEQLEETLNRKVRTVPQIVRVLPDGFTEYVGGFDELKKVFGM
jgi:glutaredoxin